MKNFAVQNGINVFAVDGSTPNWHTRSSRKLPGNEISFPCLPTPSSISAEINHLVQGHCVLGEPCVPYTIHKHFAEKGIIQTREVQVHARKVPITTIRTKLLKDLEEQWRSRSDRLVNQAEDRWRRKYEKHQQFMRLSGDREIELLSHEEAQPLLQSMQCQGSGLSLAEMKTIQKYQRSRLFCHDHGTALGSGIILVTAHIIYDPAVFMRTHEYHLTPGLKVHSVQTEI